MFSVVIPCFNDLDILRVVLAGLSSQHFKGHYEVILVDNNTNVGDIDAVYRSYFERLEITLIRQPKLAHPMAQSRARNLGLTIARYPWVVNLDADSVPGYDYLVTLQRYLEGSPDQGLIITGLREFVAREALDEVQVASGKIDFSSLPQTASPSNYGQPLDRRIPHIYQLDSVEHPWGYIHACNCAYRREDARRIGGYDEIYDGNWGYEDTDFAYRMITVNGLKPAYVPGLTCYHLDSAASVQVDRRDKRNNVNWQTLIQRIPGYAEHKRTHFQDMNADISI